MCKGEPAADEKKRRAQYRREKKSKTEWSGMEERYNRIEAERLIEINGGVEGGRHRHEGNALASCWSSRGMMRRARGSLG